MIDPVKLAQELVRIDTSGGGEERAARLCGDLLQRAGAEVEVVPAGPGRAHVLAAVGNVASRPLILSGHLDTVSADPDCWQNNPWSGDLVDGELYGRGAADMKGGVAALVAALARQARAWKHERGVLLVLTADEEAGCAGAKHLVRSRKLPAGGPMLVTEPTRLSIALGHKGALWLRATARGRSAHGSAPHLGKNAITALARFVLALEEGGLATTRSRSGGVTVNVGRFNGGTRINLVPDHASAEIDLRTPAGLDSSALLEDISALAGPEDIELEVLQDLASVQTATGGPFYAMFSSLVRKVMGEASVREPLAYFTDAAVLSPALNSSEVLIFGPGDPGQAHTVDESCPVDHIQTATLVFEVLLQSWREQGQGELL
ncbi:MAG: M20 family metallopeptidase [Anaerosomatales bacterium]|nr:M20 family metallopeptidase [Anaerosomatales bacterium]